MASLQVVGKAGPDVTARVVDPGIILRWVLGSLGELLRGMLVTYADNSGRPAHIWSPYCHCAAYLVACSCMLHNVSPCVPCPCAGAACTVAVDCVCCCR